MQDVISVLPHVKEKMIAPRADMMSVLPTSRRR
jgi:hypothetical protein